MSSVESAPTFWRDGVSLEDVLERIETPTLAGVVAAMYDAHAEAVGATMWVCKENLLFDFAHALLDAKPDARFLYLVRDGRDVVVSSLASPLHRRDAYHIARNWADEQRRGMAMHNALVGRGKSLRVRYEDLITRPEEEARRIASFLDLPFEEGMLRFFERSQARHDAGRTEYRKNLQRPIMSDNKNKFLTRLRRRTLEEVEGVAGTELSLLGYDTVTDGRQVGTARRLVYRLLGRIRHERSRKALHAREPGRAAMRRTVRGLVSNRRKNALSSSNDMRSEESETIS